MMSEHVKGDGPKPRSRMSVGTVVLTVALAWFGYLLFFGPRGQFERLPTITPTDPGPNAPRAQYGWGMADLQGQRVSFEQFRGKVVFLNVWATWCPPCIEELPSIASLAKNPKVKDVAIVCASVDDSAEDVRGFLRARDPGLPNVLRVTEGLPPIFVTQGIPATFIISADGRVVFRYVGSARWDDPGIVDFLAELAAKPSS